MIVWWYMAGLISPHANSSQRLALWGSAWRFAPSGSAGHGDHKTNCERWAGAAQGGAGRAGCWLALPSGGAGQASGVPGGAGAGDHKINFERCAVAAHGGAGRAGCCLSQPSGGAGQQAACPAVAGLVSLSGGLIGGVPWADSQGNEVGIVAVSIGLRGINPDNESWS